MHKRWSKMTKVVIFAMFFLFCFTFVMILNIDHWSTVLSQFVPGLSAYIYALSIEGIQNTILLHVHFQRRYHQPTMCPTIFFPFLLFTGRLWCSNPPSTNPTVNRFEHISSIICPLLLSAPLMNPLSRAHRDSHLMSCITALHHNDHLYISNGNNDYITNLNGLLFYPSSISAPIFSLVYLCFIWMYLWLFLFVSLSLFWLFVFLCFQSGKFVWHGCLGDWRPDPDSGGDVAASCWWRW